MDIDEELAMLQRELMSVQQQKANPFSERTVAQIMIKLQQSGFKFYATTDGNQYITPQKLDNEIIEFIKQRGRTKIYILPQLLNLNGDLIESRINQICKKSTHLRNNDNLISQEYIQNFIHSLKQQLEIQGTVSLDQLAVAQEFSMPFLMAIINHNIRELDAEVVGKQLSTMEYRRMKKRRILGFLLAVDTPLSIEELLKVSNLADANPVAHIEELISEGKLKGKCQSSYYIPDKFRTNQKQLIQKMFDVNGYLDFAKLQQTFQVSKPEDWIKKNLKGSYVIFQSTCINKSNLLAYQLQVESFMKTEGFFDVSSVIPFEMDDKTMERFLAENCQLKEFVLDEGICYSEEWLTRCANEFRDKAIYDIFFKKSQGKGKKKTKKDKEEEITQSELVETVFDAGLAEYSVAEHMADSLAPLINKRIAKLKLQLQKELAQSQRVLNNAFLRYRKCKSIKKSQENLQRVLNTIEKDKKKGVAWSDPDFGPSQSDPQGKYSLIYYDGIVPKDWPQLDRISWKAVPFSAVLNAPPSKSPFFEKALLINMLQILDHRNAQQGQPFQSPNFSKIPHIVEEGQQSPSAPFAFRFYTGEKQCKYVLVDNKLPFVNEQCFGSGGLYGLIEKAYAKLRYCYKGMLSVGVQQLIFELTGITPLRITIASEKDEAKVADELMQKYLGDNCLVVVMGEGEGGKKIKCDGTDTQLRCAKPYQVSSVQNQKTLLRLFPGQCTLDIKHITKMFRNIYIIQRK